MIDIILIGEALKLDIADTRAAQRSPSQMGSHQVGAEFTNQIVSGWHSLINMAGWTSSSYANWQLIGPSDTTAHENWYLRSGVGTSTSNWGSLREIVHTGNYTDYVVAKTGGTMSGELNVSRNGGATGSSAPSYSQANIELQTR